MASADLKKYTMSSMKGMRVHFDDKLRGTVCHENKHINKELSHLNDVIGCAGYNDMLNKLNQRIKECDSINPPKRYKKDRVVACSIEIKCPQQLTDEGKSQEWFEACYKHLCDKYGKDNVVGGFVHRDEIHNYYDSELKQWVKSLEHCNFVVVPQCQWLDKNNNLREGVNAKNFVTRAMLKDLNKSIDDLCVNKFQCYYMTYGLPRHQSVEELKRASNTKEQILANESRASELANEILEYCKAMDMITGDITSTSAFQNALNDRLAVEGLKQAKSILQKYNINQSIIKDIDKRIKNQERTVSIHHGHGISL